MKSGSEFRLEYAEGRRLLRRAYESEYRFPQGFDGFVAGVCYMWDRESWAGTLEVHSPSRIMYGGRLRCADEMFKWEVAAMVGQKWGIPFDDAEGSLEISVGGDDRILGRTVHVADGLGSRYHVRGGEIRRVRRTYGDLDFTVTIQDRVFASDGRSSPSHYCITYWSITHDRIVRTDIYHDEYREIDGMMLPLSRRIIASDDSGTTARSIRFSNHRMPGNATRKAS